MTTMMFVQIIRLVGEVFSSPEKLGVCFAHCLTSEDNTNDNEESDEMDVSDNTSDTANDSQSGAKLRVKLCETCCDCRCCSDGGGAGALR